MQIEEIRVGRWYATARGVGVCLIADSCHPPKACFLMKSPFPGHDVFDPEQVYEEVLPLSGYDLLAL